MPNLPYISNRINDLREQNKKNIEDMIASFAIVTKAAGGILPMIEKRFAENQTRTLVRGDNGLYQRMSVLALRMSADGKTLEVGLAPTTETLSPEDIIVAPKNGKWPKWVPLENGPCIKLLTVQEIGKTIWQFIDNIEQK